MTKSGTLVAIAFLSASSLAFPVVAAETDGVMMKDGKMMMMKDGKATGPMDHEMAVANCCTVMPDGTMKMKDGQMMTMDGKMKMSAKKGMKMEGMKKEGMERGMGMKGGMGMKMEGMGK